VVLYLSVWRALVLLSWRDRRVTVVLTVCRSMEDEGGRMGYVCEGRTREFYSA
jgi:hypothetical protein